MFAIYLTVDSDRQWLTDSTVREGTVLIIEQAAVDRKSFRLFRKNTHNGKVFPHGSAHSESLTQAKTAAQ